MRLCMNYSNLFRRSDIFTPTFCRISSRMFTYRTQITDPLLQRLCVP